MGMIGARLERHGRLERGEEGSGGTTVWLDDHRYGFVSAPRATPFSARFDFDSKGRLTEARLEHGIGEASLGAELGAAWRTLWGGG
jgi:hypothetical protein